MKPLIYEFGEFRVDAEHRLLLRNGQQISLTPKVFDLLLVFIENRGEMLEKDRLMGLLWPDSFVEESNIVQNVAVLRRALGERSKENKFIVTIPGRGYRFVAEVTATNGNAPEGPTGVPEPQKTPVTRTGNVLTLVRPGGARAAVALAAEEETEPSLSIQNDTPLANISAAADVTARRPRWHTFAAIFGIIATIGLMTYLGTSYTRSMSGEKSAAMKNAAQPLKMERLTASGDSYNPAISPDGKYAAYSRLIEQKHSLWLRQLVTGTSVQVVATARPISGIAFDHSVNHLYYVESGSPSSLYRVSLVGGVPVKLLDGLHGKLALSNDDAQIAFVREGSGENGKAKFSLVTVNTDGKDERVLLTSQSPDKLDAPVWSPDNSSIICAYGSPTGGGQRVGLVEVNASSGTWTELGIEKFYNINSMAWLPGKGLLMSATKGADDYQQLWHIAYPGMETRQVTEGHLNHYSVTVTADGGRVLTDMVSRVSDLWTSENGDGEHPKKITGAIDNFCWTPDGRLVYSSMAGGSRNIWIMRPDGTEQKQLTTRSATDATPAVSPDGSYIVFVSTQGGAFQVWRMNIDGTNQIKLTEGEPKNFPTVSPDGKWVLYNSTIDWRAWKVSIDGGEPQPVTDHICYMPSVSPDGQTIACVGGKPRSEVLILPVDGGQPLRSFDLGGQVSSGTRIQWAPNGDALFFALYNNVIWTLTRQPLDGGPREDLMKFEDTLFDFGFSPDGQMLAVTRGGWQHDVVLINDLDRLIY
jgi:Tol biopolymer transport system component/DNA-binding winged helix-turn-helix (wHTH) protein